MPHIQALIFHSKQGQNYSVHLTNSQLPSLLKKLPPMKEADVQPPGVRTLLCYDQHQATWTEGLLKVKL